MARGRRSPPAGATPRKPEAAATREPARRPGCAVWWTAASAIGQSGSATARWISSANGADARSNPQTTPVCRTGRRCGFCTAGSRGVAAFHTDVASIAGLPPIGLTAAWSPDGSDPRRQWIRDRSPRQRPPQAATVWQQISSSLDAYLGGWRDMYQETCEATHVPRRAVGGSARPADALPQRKPRRRTGADDPCSRYERSDLPGALTKIGNLTPVARCANLSILRSTVPLPRDEKTLQTVERIRSSLRTIQTMFDVGRAGVAMKMMTALRAEVEATQYKPLLADSIRC